MRRGRIGVGFGFAGGAVNEADTWETAVVGDGGTVSGGRKTLVSDLIAGLKTDGVWTKLDRLNLYAAENTQSALRDIRNATLSTANGSPAFATDEGYTGGTGKYIDTGFDPGAGGTQYLRDSAHLGYWALVLDTVGKQGWLDAGATIGGYLGWANDTGGAIASEINQTFNAGVLITNSVGTSGHGVITRTGASASQVYINNTSVVSNTVASVDISAAGNVYFLARNFNGTANSPSATQVAVSHIGGALTGTDVTNLRARLSTYLTAVGAI